MGAIFTCASESRSIAAAASPQRSLARARPLGGPRGRTYQARLVTALATLPLLALPLTAIASGYRPIEVGGLGGAYADGNRINNSRQVLGHSTSDSSDPYFLDTFLGDADGTLHAIPAYAEGMNNLGHAVGAQVTVGLCGYDHLLAFDWSPSTGLRSLAPLPGDDQSNAQFVNDVGAATGMSGRNGTFDHAVAWIDGQPRSLGVPDGSYVLAINNAGQILGSRGNGKRGRSYFVWTVAGGAALAPSLTRPGDASSEALTLNNAGQIGGASTDFQNAGHAVIWDPVAGLIDIGALAGDNRSTLLALNAGGEVLGFSQAGYSGERHYFVWDHSGGIRPVPVRTPFVNLNGMNDAGDLVGTRLDAAGASRAVSYQRDGTMLRVFEALGGGWSVGSAINNEGQITGSALDVTGRLQAYRWSEQGGIENMGAIPGVPAGTEGKGINDQGTIAGTTSLRDGVLAAFVGDHPGGLQNIGSLVGSASGAEAAGINNFGQVVGWTIQSGASGPSQLVPFLWDAAHGMSVIPFLPEFNSFLVDVRATAINDQSTVVGYGTTADMSMHSWVWDSRNGARDIGSLTGGSTRARALDRLGVIVGSSTAPSSQCGYSWHAFKGSGARMENLGVLAGDQTSDARGINSRGDVVGASGDVKRAFLYRHKAMIDLTARVADAHWQFLTANAINDAGQITGEALHDGRRRAYVLVRAQDDSQGD